MLTIHNKRIIDFYNDHKELSFEAVNILLVNLFEKILDKKHESLNSLVHHEILSNVQNINQQLELLNSKQEHITDNINLRLHETKDAYIETMRNILIQSQGTNNERINMLMQQQNDSLIDKTTILLNEVVPKSNAHYYDLMQNILKDFRVAMETDTCRLLDNTDKTSLLHVIETKVNQCMQQFQQPLFSFINSSEERLSKNMDKINNDNISSQSVMNELASFLGKYKNSSMKGQYGETQLEGVLNTMFPSAGIFNTTGETASCDFRIERANAPVILVETKAYDRNVSIDEVKKFIRDIDAQKKHGIFLSQNTGITSKQNYQIDIRGKNILIYVHCVDYNPEKIKIAIDIIDSLCGKVEEMHNKSGILDGFCISKEIMDDINSEYSDFVARKMAMINIMKDFQKRMLGELDEIKFPCLSKYLADKYGGVINDSNETINCSICNNYIAKNNRALASHQRNCKKKHDQINIAT
jgi:hypothetical protein